jgi:hypothetical protein
MPPALPGENVTRLAPLNVLNDSLRYGRFSGDHVWPVLGVHRGEHDYRLVA